MVRKEFSKTIYDFTRLIMKIRTNNNGMKQLKDLGFKKIKTEPGFHMYELTPARLNSFDSNFRAQVPIKKKVKR